MLLTACDRNSDAQLQAKLPGTWKLSRSVEGSSVHSTIIVGPGGTYDGEVISAGSDEITRTSILSGTMEIHHGLLIDTTTKHSNTNAPLPMIFTSSIVRLDGLELVIKYPPNAGGDFPTNEIILRKEGK